MSKPAFVRTLSDEERATLQAGLRASDSFTLRRCQILLASAAGTTSPTIAKQLGCSEQTVRNVVRQFNIEGLTVLHRGSHVAHHLPHTAFSAEGLKQLQLLLQRSPRVFGKSTSVWTLQLLAEVCFAQGLTTRKVSGETIRATLERLGIQWKRAKHWIKSPDPDYTRKKTDATG